MQPTLSPQSTHIQSLFSKLGYDGTLNDQIRQFQQASGVATSGAMDPKVGDPTFDALRAKMVGLRETVDNAPALSDIERRLLGIEQAPKDPRVDSGRTTQKGSSPEVTKARLDAQLAENQVTERVTGLLDKPVPVPGKSTSDYVRPGESSANWVQDRMLTALGRDTVPEDVKSDFTKTVKYYQEKRGLLLEGQTQPDGKAGPQTLKALQEDLRKLPAETRAADASTKPFTEHGLSPQTAGQPKASAATAGVTPLSNAGVSADISRTAATISAGMSEAKVDGATSETSAIGGGVSIPAGAAIKAGAKAAAPKLDQAATAAKAKADALRAKLPAANAAEAAKDTKAWFKARTFVPEGGEDFRSIAERSSKAAKESNVAQKIKVNGAKILVNPGETANDVAMKLSESTKGAYAPDRAQDPAFRKALNEKLAKDGITPRIRDGESLNQFKERASGYHANIDKSVGEIEGASKSALRERMNAELEKKALPKLAEGQSLDELKQSRAGKGYADSIDKVAEKFRLEERATLNTALKDRGLRVRMGEGQSVSDVLKHAGADKASAQKVVAELMNEGKLSSIQHAGAVRPAPSTVAAASTANASAKGSKVLTNAAATSMDGAAIAAKAGKGLLSFAGKAALPVGAAMSAYNIHEAYERDTVRNDGKMTETRKAVGSEVGGWAGAAGGAAIGAAWGTAIPIPIAGTLLGGIAGGIIGYFGGSKLGEEIAKEPTAAPTSMSELGPAA